MNVLDGSPITRIAQELALLQYGELIEPDTALECPACRAAVVPRVDVGSGWVESESCSGCGLVLAA